MFCGSSIARKTQREDAQGHWKVYFARLSGGSHFVRGQKSTKRVHHVGGRYMIEILSVEIGYLTYSPEISSLLI